MNDKVLVFTTSQEYLASIISDKLRNEKIDCWVLNQKDSSYNAFGNIEIYVLPEDEEKAKALIETDNE